MADGKVTISTALDDSGAKSGMQKLGSTLSSVSGAAIKGTAVAIGAVSTAIVGLGATAVKYNANMEQYATSFEVMTGSAEKSAEVMEKLKEIGASTPFEFQDLADATQTLMAFGFSADEAIEQFNVLGDISQGNSQKLETMSRALGKMESSGKVSLEAINMMIDQGYNPLNNVAERTGETMEELYSRVSNGTISVDEIKQAMVDATSEGGQFFGSMEKQSQTLNGRISTLKDNFSQFTGSLFSDASGSAKNVVELAIEYVNILSDALAENGVDGLVEAIGNILADVVAKASEFAPTLIELAINLLNSLINGIVSNLDLIINSSLKIINSLVKGIVILLPQILKVGIEVLLKLAQGIVEAIPELLPAIVEVVMEIVKMITDNIGQFITVAFEIIVALAQGIIEALPELIPAIVDIVLEIVDALLDNLDLLIDVAVDLILALADGLIKAIPKLLEKAPEIIKKLVKAFVTNAPMLAGAAIEIILELGKGLISAIPDLIKSIPEILNAIIEGLSDGVSAVFDIGKDLVEGLWNGIKDMGSWIKDKITGFGEDVMDSLKSFFGIHSPSTLMRDIIGKNLALGIGVGFEQNNPLEQISDSLSLGMNSVKTSAEIDLSSNIRGTYENLGNIMVDALEQSGLTVKIGEREFGRIVRSVG